VTTPGVGTWSVVSGTAIVASNNNAGSSVNSLSNGNNVFAWSVTNGACSAATSTVFIVRDIQPTSNAGADQTICTANATLAAVTPTTGSGSWSLFSGSGTILAPSNPSAQVLAVGTGTNMFVWTVTSGFCTAATSTATIIKTLGLSANAGVSQSVCASNVTLAAVIPTAGSGVWSVVTGTGSPVNSSSAGSQINSLSYGLNSFLWTVSNGSCPTATSLVDVWREVAPTANAGINQTICSANATLSAVSPTLGTGLWSIVSGAATQISLNIALSALSAVASGTNVFMWTVVNGVCIPATSTVAIVRDLQPIAQAGNDQTVCSAITTLAATVPAVGTGTWSVFSGAAVISSSTSASSALTALGSGSNTFVWTVNNGVCPNATSTVVITRDMPPTSQAGSDQAICGTSATLAAVSPTIGVGQWSILNGTVAIASPASSNSQLTGLVSGTNSLLWTVVNGVCPAATSTVNIISNLNPGAANAGGDFTVCSSNCTISALTATPGNGVWSIYNTTAAIVSQTAASSGVTNLNSGANQFVWTTTNGVCPPSQDTVLVYFTIPLIAASAGNDQHLCINECTLTANNAGYGNWTIVSGNATIGSVSGATTQITSLGTGTNIFVWLVSKAFCLSTADTVIIIRDREPGLANAGADQRVCGADVTLSANLAFAGDGIWKITNGSSTVTDFNLSQTFASGLSAGLNQFVWTLSNGVCPSSGDTVNIQSDAIPSDARAGTDRLVCADEIVLDAKTIETGIGNWSVLSGTGAVSQPSANNTFLTGLKEGVHLLKWSVVNGVCAEKSDTVQITRTFTPISPDAGIDQVLETATAQLGANIPQAGLGTWSVITGSCEFSDIHDKNASIARLPFGNTILRWTVANKSCTDVSDDMVIYVKDLNIPNAFSPNGDGINDRFVITSLDYYKQVKISVFNSWGNLLYHNTEYHNDWSGVNTNNENLANDTYYYIIEIPELKNFTGFIIVKRDK